MILPENFKRAKQTGKPDVLGHDVIFIRHADQFAIVESLDRIMLSDTLFSPEIEILQPKVFDQSGIDLNYEIVGGYDNNAIVVDYDLSNLTPPGDEAHLLYLKTFSGSQHIYLSDMPIKGRHVFALTGKDAYVYCDEVICKKCTFRCKRGFELFLLLKSGALYKKELIDLAQSKLRQNLSEENGEK